MNMKLILLITILSLFIISCKGGGGAGGSSTPDNIVDNIPDDSNNNNSDDSNNQNTLSEELFYVNFKSRKMNISVVEINDQNEILSEYPLLYNYQPFVLSANSIKIKAQCSECTKYAIEKNSFITNPIFLNPNIDQAQPLQDGFVANFEAFSTENFNVTISGYNDNDEIISISYLNVSNLDDSSQKIIPPEGVQCSQKMIAENQSKERSVSVFNATCLNDGAYLASGYLDKINGMFHIVYFDSDPNNVGKEMIMYSLYDLKNLDIQLNDQDDLKNYFNSSESSMLKKFSLVVADNLNLADRAFQGYPAPQIMKDEQGNLLIASAVGNTKVLNFYKYDSFANNWVDNPLGSEIANVKKIAFSKRFDEGNIQDVIYILLNDGSFKEVSIMGGMPMVEQAYSFSNAMSLYDFSVDFNEVSQVTKFAFINIESGNKVLNLAKYQQNFQLINTTVNSCFKEGAAVTFSSITSSVNVFNPVIRVADDGRAWFKVNSSEKGLFGSYAANNVPYVFNCKEDKLNQGENLQADGFNDSFSYLFDESNWSGNFENSRSLGGDFVLTSVTNEDTEDFDFFNLGFLRTTSALFGNLPHVYKIHTGYYFPLWVYDNSKRDLGIEDFTDYVNEIKLYTSGNYDIITLANYYNYDSNTNSVTSNKICLSVSNNNSNDFNSYQDKFLGINDLEFNIYDADDDGLDDYFEVYLGLNPSSIDSDNDGVSDYDQAMQACAGN